ncbi:DUF3800 domain-containing protein [Verrucomicrobiaceae bacterium 227]
MRKVYMDESGYTGEDLLNGDQQFQAASSVEITEDEAEGLINKHFPARRSPELKHQKLSKRPAYWKGLGDLQEELLQNFPCHSYIFDKKFMLIQKFLGNCTEPFYHSQGIDFYADGQAESAASLLHLTGETLFGKERIQNFWHLYQRTVRKKREADVRELVSASKELMAINLEELFGPLGSGFSVAVEDLLIEGVNLDLAYPLVLGLVSLFERRDGEYEIIHDQSENLKGYSESFQSLVGVKDEESFRFSNVSELNFPLKLRRVSQVDSKSSSAVQLADILVGGIIEATKVLTVQPEKANAYTERLWSIYDTAPEQALIFQLPSLDFDQISKHRQGNQSKEFIEFAAKRLK